MLPDNAADEARQRKQKNQLSRDKVEDMTRDEIAKAIKKVDDPEAREALEKMFEVMTGDEVTDRNNGNGNK